MSFARPDLLWLAALLPALVALGLWAHVLRRRRVARSLGEPRLVMRLGGAGLHRFPTARLVLLCAAAAAIGIAAAGPGWGWTAVEHSVRGRNIVLALDVSKSMWAQDVSPDRLERQRTLTRRLLRDLRGDRLGMVVFAGRAHILSPLTTDYSALELFVDALDPQMVSRGGSGLSLAIRQAADLARGASTSPGDRAVVLVGDGEALEDRSAVLAAADRAASVGVVVHTVGIGTPSGAPIPDRSAGGHTTGYIRWRGEIVVSRLDEELLREVAARTGGVYVRADQPGATDRLLSALAGLDRASLEGERRMVRPDRFAWFVALALLLLALDTVLARRAAAARAAYGSAVPTPMPAPPRAWRPAGRRALSRASVAALALSFALTGYVAGDLERGNRLYRDGRYAEAVEAYRSALAAGRDTPELHYNLGTALLRLGEYEAAERHLQAALAAADPDVQKRAHYNLGNRFLDEARRTEDPAARNRLLDSAIEAYREALRVNPGDTDAKWNLELALRDPESAPQQPDTGGGGGDGDEPDEEDDGGAAGADDDPFDGPAPEARAGESDPGPLSQEEAERILSGAEQQERDLTRDRFREQRREPPVERDW